jgi:transposase
MGFGADDQLHARGTAHGDRRLQSPAQDGAQRCAADAVCRRFMTVPGVGPIAALTFKVAVDDPHRFSRSRTVGAHFGLTPKRHQSGSSIDFTGCITKQGDISVREALCEAAASMMLRSRRRSAIRAWGLKIAKKRSMLCAITAVARKLAAVLLGFGLTAPSSCQGSAPR